MIQDFWNGYNSGRIESQAERIAMLEDYVRKLERRVIDLISKYNAEVELVGEIITETKVNKHTLSAEANKHLRDAVREKERRLSNESMLQKYAQGKINLFD